MHTTRPVDFDQMLNFLAQASVVEDHIYLPILFSFRPPPIFSSSSSLFSLSQFSLSTSNVRFNFLLLSLSIVNNLLNFLSLFLSLCYLLFTSFFANFFILYSSLFYFFLLYHLHHSHSHGHRRFYFLLPPLGPFNCSHLFTLSNSYMSISCSIFSPISQLPLHLVSEFQDPFSPEKH